MHRKTVVQTRDGSVQGSFTGRCLLFAGMPYAAPPTGARRFQPPAPPMPWTGVRDATHFGPIQPQSPSRFARFYGPDPQLQSEDSLVLNVWTPAADDGRRPVLVFLHGGAFVSGSGSLPMYHGEAFAARQGLVAVSLNYRLAEGGSLYLGHRDAQYATFGTPVYWTRLPRCIGYATTSRRLAAIPVTSRSAASPQGPMRCWH